MKKLLKRLIASTIVISICTTYANVYADDMVNISASQSFEDYLNICIPRHLNSLQITTDGGLSYSEQIPLYDFETFTAIGTVVFVFDNHEPIGKVELYQNDNGFSSFFDPTITEDIDDAIIHNESIALGYYKDSVLLYSPIDGYKYIDGMENEEQPSDVPDLLGIAEVCNLLNPYTAQPAVVVGSKILNNFVENYHVANQTITVDGEKTGICWAATFAMLMNYCHDSEYTAKNIYDIAVDNDLEKHSSNVAEYLHIIIEKSMMQ